MDALTGMIVNLGEAGMGKWSGTPRIAPALQLASLGGHASPFLLGFVVFTTDIREGIVHNVRRREIHSR